MEDMVLAINIAGCVLAATSLLGLLIACSRSTSWTYAISATLYFVTSLPVLAAGGFVVTYWYAHVTPSRPPGLAPTLT